MTNDKVLMTNGQWAMDKLFEGNCDSLLRLCGLFIRVFVALIFVFSNAVFAQKPAYIHYTLQEGLPSLQVFDIEQDEKGFIWIATAMGVSKFDGKQFTTFTANDGLPNNSVYLIKQDDEGRLWLLNANGESCFIQNDEVRWASALVFGNPIPQIGDIINEYTLENLRNQQQNQSQPRLDKLPNQKQYFTQSISCEFYFSETELWLGTWGDGAFWIRHFGTDSLQVQSFLPDKIITSILQDQEGNIWFATLNEGVFLLTNPETSIINQASGLANEELHSITLDSKGDVWLGNSVGGLSHIVGFQSAMDAGTPLNIQNIEPLSFSRNTYNRVNHILLDAQNNVWLCSDADLEILLTENRQLNALEVGAFKEAIVENKNSVWVAGHQKTLLWDTYKGQAIATIALKGVNSITKDANNLLWLGTNKGLYTYLEDTLFYWGNREKILSYKITDIQGSPPNRVWVATAGHGVVLVNQGTDIIHITQQTGLLSDICQSIFVDNKNQVWVATNKGLSHISLVEKSKDWGKQAPEIKVDNYTYLDGLASNHVNDVWVQDGTIYAATLKGLSILKARNTTSKTKPLVYIQNVAVWNKNTSLKPRYSLPYHQNNIRIDYIGLSYKSDGKVSYQYRMKGIDTRWTNTTLATIQYPTLPSGNYVFEVKAIDKDGQWSETSAQVEFWVSKPIWRTWAFRLLVCLLLLALIGLGAYLVIQYFRQRNELQRKMLESEQMALRAQMNPHFIFNSLNAIQYFITENDKKSANLYLSVFANLIRKVLANSQKSSITLEEELEYLGLYLEIESLRFKGKFQYQIKTMPEVEIDEISVPPMLIQPYVENAIQHGLLQKQADDRVLHILFQQTNEHILTCTITDNGIGREKAAELKRKRPNYKGIGTTNPKERLAILNRMNQGQIEVKVVDRLENGQVSGTVVHINIPVL